VLILTIPHPRRPLNKPIQRGTDPNPSGSTSPSRSPTQVSQQISQRTDKPAADTLLALLGTNGYESEAMEIVGVG